MSKAAFGQELERKIVLHNLPKIELGKPEPYRQIYQPGMEDGLAVRLRQEGNKLVLQAKLRQGSGTGDSFESDKLDLTNQLGIFEAWWRSAINGGGRPVEKDRYTLDDSLTSPGVKEIVIDVFRGDNLGHILMEAEFETADEKKMWQMPTWAIEAGAYEVTGDERYTNEYIARHGWIGPY